jgi:hypothetical protein
MEFCVPVVLFLVSFNAESRTDVYALSFDVDICLLIYPTIKFVSLLFMAYCTLGHGRKYRVCMLGHLAQRLFYV